MNNKEVKYTEAKVLEMLELIKEMNDLIETIERKLNYLEKEQNGYR